MVYSFDKVAKGISAYIDSEIYARMNDIQELVARVVVGKFLENDSQIRNALTSNGFIRTFGFIDQDGMIDIDSLAESLKKEISRKGKVSINIPMFGKLTFVSEDVDTLCRYIKGA